MERVVIAAQLLGILCAIPVAYYGFQRFRYKREREKVKRFERRIASWMILGALLAAGATAYDKVIGERGREKKLIQEIKQAHKDNLKELGLDPAKYAKIVETRRQVIIPDVFFPLFPGYPDYESEKLPWEVLWQLGPHQKRVLDLIAEFLKEGHYQSVIIEAYTDETIETAELALAIAERRASVVREYLIRRGVERKILNTLAYGKERPLVFGHDRAAWKWNNRVAFTPSMKEGDR